MTRRIEGEMDEPIAPGRIPINLAIQIGFWIVAAMLTYTAVVARVSVVESSVLATERRLDRIETKVDALLDRRP